MQVRHNSAKIQSKDLKQYLDWGRGLDYALGINAFLW